MATKFFAPTAAGAGTERASSAGKANVAAPARKKLRRFIGGETLELIVGDYIAVSVDGKVLKSICPADSKGMPSRGSLRRGTSPKLFVTPRAFHPVLLDIRGHSLGPFNSSRQQFLHRTGLIEPRGCLVEIETIHRRSRCVEQRGPQRVHRASIAWALRIGERCDVR